MFQLRRKRVQNRIRLLVLIEPPRLVSLRDSSDDEQLDLRPTAPYLPHLTEQTTLMRRRIRIAGSSQEASSGGETSGEVQMENSAPSGLR